MTNPKFSAMRTAVRGTFDRRLVGGMIIGAAIMISAMATAAPDSNGSWFSGMFNTGSSTGGATQDLLTLQESAISDAMMEELKSCDIKSAIQAAIDAHSAITMATPNVESLFDINNDCFASITNILDLSNSIPSLDSILSAAQAAILDYAKKKVCTAVNKVSGMVVNPLNQAIGKVNNMPGFGDINGMVNSQVGGALGMLDPNLGAEYHPPVAAGTYTINPNPFSIGQTAFGTGTTPGTTPGTSPGAGNSSGQINADIATINALTTQIAEQQNRTNESQWSLQAAQSSYASCDNQRHDCSGAAAAVGAAQQTLAQNQAQLLLLNQRLSQVTVRTAGSSPTPAAAAQTQATTASPQAAGSFWSNVSSLFK